MRRSTALVLVIVGLAPPAAAQAKLGIGLYLPDVPASAAERFAYIKRLAQHLSASTGLQLEGQVYRSTAELERAVKAQKIKLALVGGLFAAGRPYQRLAQARVRSAGDRTWSIMAPGKVALSALRGKTLLVPRLGPRTVKIVENGVLGGELELSKFFKISQAPDLSAALAAVKLGKAAAVVAPVSSPGLSPVIGGLPLPPPALIAARDAGADLVAKVGKAVLSYGAALGPVHGWERASDKPYRAALRFSQPRVHPMVMAEVAAGRVPARDVVAIERIKPALRDHEDLFWVP